MEFNEKLQHLRKQKDLTQEQLAEALYVSRTAISKWESGRGYPSIDSLKAIAEFFAVTVDELLSGEELLTLAEENTRQTKKNILDHLFGLLDLSALMVFLLPLFAQRGTDVVQSVSLLSLSEVQLHTKVLFYVCLIAMTVNGALILALQNCNYAFWQNYKIRISLVLSSFGVLLFMLSLQPYAAACMFLFLIVKVLVLMKK